MDGGIRTKLKVRTTSFNHGKRYGNMAEYKICSYSLRKANKQAKCRYRDKVESQFNGSDTRHVAESTGNHGLQKETSHVTDTFVTLPDKLNTVFARFEDNRVPPLLPTNKDCSPLSFSMADI
jgi:hypothetical protein